MNIKIDMPTGGIPEWVINDIKKKLIEFHHKYKEISTGHVIFNHKPVAFDRDYICEIELTIYGSSIMVQRNGNSYKEAAREAIKELSEKLQKQIQKQQENEPPDEIISTVDIDKQDSDD